MARITAAGIDPNSVKLYNGPMDVARHVLRHEGGVFGLYRGMNSTLLREIPGNMAMFGVYEALRTYFAHQKVIFSLFAQWMFLGASKSFAIGSTIFSHCRRHGRRSFLASLLSFRRDQKQNPNGRCPTTRI